MRLPFTSGLLTSLLLLSTACSNDDAAPEPEPRAGDPGPSPLRRLTRVEYNNAVFQLFGDTSQPANAFVPEETALGFDNQAAALVVSPLLAEQLLDAAEALAARHAPAIVAGLASCESAQSLDDACTTQAESWLRGFGKEVFRRPMTDDEVAEWLAVLGDGAALEGVSDPAPSVARERSRLVSENPS